MREIGNLQKFLSGIGQGVSRLIDIGFKMQHGIVEQQHGKFVKTLTVHYVKCISQQFYPAIVAIELVGTIGFIGVKLQVFLIGYVAGFCYPFVGFIIKGLQPCSPDPLAR